MGGAWLGSLGNRHQQSSKIHRTLSICRYSEVNFFFGSKFNYSLVFVVPSPDPSLLSEVAAAVVEEPAEVPRPPVSSPPPGVGQLGEEDEFSRLPQGETFLVHVKKESGTFGLRIAGGKGKPFGGGFIYVKTLVKDSPAERCRRLQEGDIIMKVCEDHWQCRGRLVHFLNFSSDQQPSSAGHHPQRGSYTNCNGKI